MPKKSRKLPQEKRKYRFPVDLHLKQAVGALTLHTGVGTYMYCQSAIKKANPARVGEHPSPVSNGDRCKYRDSFWKCNKKGGSFFRFRQFKNIIAYLSIMDVIFPFSK